MATFRQDDLHSSIEFKIKHLMISNVKGRFSSFEAIIISDSDDFSESKVFCEIKVSSINTGIRERDKHLKSDDFFDSKKYPTINFVSREIIKKENSNEFELLGTLRIKKHSAPVSLKVIYNGKDVDNYGVEKHGFDINGSLKRSDWNLDFNIPGGKNTLLIGDDVEIDISLQMVEV